MIHVLNNVRITRYVQTHVGTLFCLIRCTSCWRRCVRKCQYIISIREDSKHNETTVMMERMFADLLTPE